MNVISHPLFIIENQSFSSYACIEGHKSIPATWLATILRKEVACKHGYMQGMAQQCPVGQYADNETCICSLQLMHKMCHFYFEAARKQYKKI